MYTNLNCGALVGGAGFDDAVELAVEFGFGGVSPDVGELARQEAQRPGAAAEIGEAIRARGLAWGTAGVGVDPGTPDQPAFDEGLRGLETQAAAAQAAGVDRAVRFLWPTHDERTYRENFALHARRLRAIADVLGGHGIRLGLEYVGPKTLWATGRYPFVHTAAETHELIAETGARTIGLCLDSFHWFTSGEGAEDLRELTDADVVAVDLNDARAGVDRDEQQDQQRELPGRTGVIDVAALVTALRDIGYTGPVQAEPFNAELRALPARDAVRETADALAKVLESS